MIDILALKSCSPMRPVSIPSMMISPSRFSLASLNRAPIIVDLPAPVRPTMPTFHPDSISMFKFCNPNF